MAANGKAKKGPTEAADAPAAQATPVPAPPTPAAPPPDPVAALAAVLVAFDPADEGALLLEAEAAAEILRSRGQSITAHRLRRHRTEGGGPAYSRNGAGQPRYLHHQDFSRSPLIRWAAVQLTPPADSTSAEFENMTKRSRGH